MLAMAIQPVAGARASVPAPLERGTAASRPAKALVRWAPPRLQRPLHVQVPVSGLDAYYAADRDIVLELPDVPVQGEVRTTGGDDIRVVGGKIGGGRGLGGEDGSVPRGVRGCGLVAGHDN